MTVVYCGTELENALKSKRIIAAMASCVEDTCTAKYPPITHYIEFEILTGAEGTVIVLGKRECPVQRRHRKLIEKTGLLL